MNIENDMFKKIVDWNNVRGLIGIVFDHKKETSFIIEELLESTGKYDSVTAREKALLYATEIVEGSKPEAEQIVDAMADIIFFATGTIAKLGFDPTKVMDEVYKEINSRTGTLVNGKFIRDNDAIMYKADLNSCRISSVQ